MKVALVCIAKDEDCYLDEWMKYHYKIGVDDIFLYQNDWTFKNAGQYDQNHLFVFNIPGFQTQLPAYNHFMANFAKNYDWVMILDCDEFFNLCGAYLSVKEFFEDFSDYFAVGVNWRLFGDSHLQTFDPNNCSVLKRFTWCGKKHDKIIKTFLNIKKLSECNLLEKTLFPNPHCVNFGISKNPGKPNQFTIATNKKSFCDKAYNYDLEDLPVQINHYHCKTRIERTLRVKHGRCDIPPSDPQYFYTPTDFDENNLNDLEDCRLADFAKTLDETKELDNSSISIFAADHRKDVVWNLPYIRLGNFQSDCALNIKSDPVVAPFQLLLSEGAQMWWVRRHLDDFKNPTYVGFQHYRRFFSLKLKNPIVNVTQAQFDSSLCAKPLELGQILQSQNYDGATFIPLQVTSEFTDIISQLKMLVKIEKFGELEDLIDPAFVEFRNNLGPKFANVFDNAMKINKTFCCNIFILKNNLFREFADAAFPVFQHMLEKMPKERLKTVHPRFMGYFLERFTSIYLWSLTALGYKLKIFPLLTVDANIHKKWDPTGENTYADDIIKLDADLNA